MRFHRPSGLLAGFHADRPDRAVPELVHLGEQWMPMDRRIGRHLHRVWELYLQLSGTTLWASQRRTFEVRPGDLFVAPPGVAHELVNRRSGSHHFVFAAIDFERVFRRHPALRAHWTARSCARLREADRLEAPFLQLVREVTLDLPFKAAALRAAVDALAIEATRAQTHARARSLLKIHPGVEKARHLLEHRCEERWSLADLARVVGLSPNHLAGLFKREVGQSPRRFLLRARVRRAQRLLHTSDLPVTEIGLQVGFSSSQHFAKAFKKLSGISASVYRSRGAGSSRSKRHAQPFEP